MNLIRLKPLRESVFIQDFLIRYTVITNHGQGQGKDLAGGGRRRRRRRGGR